MADMKGIRTRLGLSQVALAEKLGVHQSTISRFESGDLPLDERTALALEALAARPPVRHCALCDEVRSDGEVAACTAIDCPLRAREAA